MTAWLLLPCLGLTAVAQTIPAVEASGHIGKEATVTGRVVHIATLNNSSSRPTILDLDRPYPNAIFQVVIFEKDLPAFGDDVRATYDGKSVAVTGTISKFRDTAQMVVSSPDQIRITDGGEASSPASAPTPGVLPGSGSSVLPGSSNGEPRSEGRGSGTDRTSLPPNLLKNGDFSNGKVAWDVERGAEVVEPEDGPALRIRLSPDGVVRVSQKISTGIPSDARQYQALAQVRLAPGARLDEPVMLRLGKTPGIESHLPRRVRPGGAWHEIKWTRTADLKDLSPLLFTIEAGPGEGELWVDDVYLFAHPDYKDKATWKVSDG